MKPILAVASAAAQSPDVPWHPEGLFSAHHLARRLPDPKSALRLSEAELEKHWIFHLYGLTRG